MGDRKWERFHQVLKAGLRSNTLEDKHIIAGEHALRKYWLLGLVDLHEVSTRRN